MTNFEAYILLSDLVDQIHNIQIEENKTEVNVEIDMETESAIYKAIHVLRELDDLRRRVNHTLNELFDMELNHDRSNKTNNVKEE